MIDMTRLNSLAGELPPLSKPEYERASRFRSARDRGLWIAGRGTTRRILSLYLKQPPQDVELTKGKNHKPTIADSCLKFNVSHSGQWFTMAVAIDVDVGIDCEALEQDLETDELIKDCCSDAEMAEVGAYSPENRKLAFLRCWTRKEAVLKAIGVGLTVPLRSVCTTGCYRCSAGGRKVCFPNLHPACWTIVELEHKGMPEKREMIAMLAVELERPKVLTREYNGQETRTDVMVSDDRQPSYQ